MAGRTGTVKAGHLLLHRSPLPSSLADICAEVTAGKSAGHTEPTGAIIAADVEGIFYKLQGKLKLFQVLIDQHHAMKTYGVLEIELHHS
jgi:hypothetical protein